MNQKTALTTLIEATVDMDHDPLIHQARRIAMKRVDTLQGRYDRFHATNPGVDTENIDLGIDSHPINTP